IDGAATDPVLALSPVASGFSCVTLSWLRRTRGSLQFCPPPPPSAVGRGATWSAHCRYLAGTLAAAEGLRAAATGCRAASSAGDPGTSVSDCTVRVAPALARGAGLLRHRDLCLGLWVLWPVGLSGRATAAARLVSQYHLGRQHAVLPRRCRRSGPGACSVGPLRATPTWRAG